MASHFEHILLHPLSTHSLFPPKNYIFSYFKKESAQKVLWPMETVLVWLMMVPMWWQAIFITFNYSTFHRTHFPPTACFHPKITFSQLFHKGIKLWFSQKGIMTIGNCSRVTYDGSHKAASHFEHIPPHPLSTHSLFSPKNYIFSYLKNSKPFWAQSNPFPPFPPTFPVFTQKLHWNSWKCHFWVETGCGWKGVGVECALNYLPPHGGYHRSP